MGKLEVQPSSVSDGAPEPDVWWSADGIDALIWADPLPYCRPLPNGTIETHEPLPSGGPA
jgi:hypothetical protein